MWATCQSFIGSGNIRAKGGNGNTYGGGGAGGRINIYYVTGGFHSDQTDASGGQAGSGSSVEPGGPGVVYLEGQSPVVKNLRIDNKGRKPLVSHCFFFLLDLDFQTTNSRCFFNGWCCISSGYTGSVVSVYENIVQFTNKFYDLFYFFLRLHSVEILIFLNTQVSGLI